jgi:hypothetical protein
MESQSRIHRGLLRGATGLILVCQLAGLQNGHEQASHMAVLEKPNAWNGVSGTKRPLFWPLCSLGMRPCGNGLHCNQATTHNSDGERFAPTHKLS